MKIKHVLADNLAAVKAKSPLIHHITNYVTVNDCANMTLAIGASPVMADDIAEVEEMAGFAGALVLNIGTLNARTIASTLVAGRKAKYLGVPIVLDPVGVGATKLRTETAERIIAEIKPEVIRGNMSEIKVLAGLNVAIKGVDSVAGDEDGVNVARELAKQLNCIIAITGKTDIVSDGERVILIDNGHPMLSNVTGTGCMTTSLIGSYCGASTDYLTASVAGIVSMGLAGEQAQASLRAGEGIGTFRIRLFDAISNLTPGGLAVGAKVSVG